MQSPREMLRASLGFQRPMWAAIIPAAAAVVGGVLSSKASGKAADAEVQSAADANALNKYQYDTTRADNQPLLDARNNALTQYQSALPGLTSTFTGANVASDPGYQFGLHQGTAALDNSAANHGGLYSGAQMKAAQQFGNDYGSTKFNEAFNRDLASKNFTANQYQSLIGAGQSGVNQIDSAGQNYATQAGNNITGAGNARASGYIGNANSWSTALGQGVSGYQQNRLIDMYNSNREAMFANQTLPSYNYTGILDNGR